MASSPKTNWRTKSYETHEFEELFTDILFCEPPEGYCTHTVIGAWNGLICLYFHRARKLIPPRKINGRIESHDDSHHLILWNPCTREHYTLPNPQGFNGPYQNSPITRPGFGYDVANNTYKLVIFENHLTQIYDLSTNVWKQSTDWRGSHSIDPSDFTTQYGRYLDGSLHWIVSRKNTNENNIVSLNLSTEVISLLNLPQCKDDGRLDLGVLNGSLSISCFRGSKSEVSIWMMKEYGKVESWTNIIVQLDFRVSPNFGYKPPLWVSQSKQMVFVVSGVFGYWLPKDGKSCYFNNIEFNPFDRAIVHVNTLMSPKPEGYGLAKADNNQALV